MTVFLDMKFLDFVHKGSFIKDVTQKKGRVFRDLRDSYIAITLCDVIFCVTGKGGSI